MVWTRNILLLLRFENIAITRKRRSLDIPGERVTGNTPRIPKYKVARASACPACPCLLLPALSRFLPKLSLWYRSKLRITRCLVHAEDNSGSADGKPPSTITGTSGAGVGRVVELGNV